MNEKEKRRLDKLNKSNNWGFTKFQILTMITKHENARKRNDTESMTRIEYRFYSCGYQREYKCVVNGSYNDLREEYKNM